MARIAISLNPINPVALREMRARMRGPRAFLLVGLYLGLLTLLLYVVYLQSGGGTTYTYGGFSGSSNFGPTKSYEIGQNLFITTFLFLVFFVSLVTPAITGGVVSRELEGRTYELLVITPVRSRAVAFGKLFAALSFIFFMVVAALPMACIVFIFGGVTFEHILLGFAVVLMAAVTYGIIGLFFSAWIKHTAPAVALTYCIVAIMLVAVPLASHSITTSLNSEISRAVAGQRIDARIDPQFDLPKRMLVVNPVAALGSVLARNAPFRANASDGLQMFPNSRLFLGNPNSYYANPPGNPKANEIARKPVLPNDMPLYGGYFLVYTAISLFFFLLSLLVIKPGLRTFRGPNIKPSLPRRLLRRRAKTKAAEEVVVAPVAEETPAVAE